MPISQKVVERLYRQAGAERWRVPMSRFAEALEASAGRVAPAGEPDAATLERHLQTLHLDDLALACACAEGDDGAWEHFIRQQRPMLYRAAAALDPSGGARDLADSLYADLFGLVEQDGVRRSLFRYFHGRSSLTTWLRAVLAQRFVDRLRERRRLEALPDEESPAALRTPPTAIDPDRARYWDLLRRTLGRAVAALPARDRLRLACYYAQELTLAKTGQVLGEHEATCSRQLARTRKVVREDVERQLRAEYGLGDDQIAECFASVTRDAGALDLQQMLDSRDERKESVPDRSR